MKKETVGLVRELKIRGSEYPTVVVVDYIVDGKEYSLKESMKMKRETIKLGFLPIGQKKVPAIRCEKNTSVIIEYEENNPKKAHIKGNDGRVN